MDVYLAAPFSRRYELREFAARLEAEGIHVTASWIRQEVDAFAADTEAPYSPAVAAYKDLADIRRSQVVVAFSRGLEDQLAPSRGGCHVEFGVALAERRRLILIGPRVNVFHFVADVEQYDTDGAALEVLRAAAAEEQRQAGAWR